ncbi:hypothetical protein SLEP1_g37496 [Rubroshorea leprosula]|uniref:Uncharacterized protein n=1 Tax=Rubroshorea leprosula TaxID=152421 RepID=A0AAV5KUS1_9ROSI|nr:hypothetical protein SLEP1_g37496 [Rubroshorea leprosula]
MKIISWNCRGALKAGFRKSVTDLIRIHNPAMLLILETKISCPDAQEVANSLGFPKSCIVNSYGLAGGLWLLWDDSRLSVDILSANNQAIHAVIQGPWMIIGDFNDVVDQSEKFGKNEIPQTRARAYLDCMNHCNMVDLGFIGNRFTWANMRFSNQLIQERLDRAWANPDWKLSFPEASLFHLPHTHSDHCPILLDLNPSCPRSGSRPFRLEKFWIDHPDFQNIIHQVWVDTNTNTAKSVELTMNRAKAWSLATFGNIFKRKKKLLARIEGIQKSHAYNFSSFLWNLERDLLQQYNDILNWEADLWFMKSRTDWIADGDKNTRLFHVTTLKHRSRNRIFGLFNSQGSWITYGSGLASIAINFFAELFNTSHTHSFSDSYESLQRQFQPSYCLDSIRGCPSNKEIWDAVNSLNSFKAPGPDGTHPFFYKRMWPLIGEKISCEVRNIFLTRCIPPKWNECLLVLIPKLQSPGHIHQFRPISLCNTIYKIISKILVHRIKPWMDKIISPGQSSFIPGRQGTDNILILQELVHSFSKKTGQTGDMICKLDLEKAFDRLEWSFIYETLLYFQFPLDIVKLIMNSARGIRQGDPLSPYIFILCMEYLSIRISVDMEAGLWKGTKCGRRGPSLSHIFFADDIIFIGKATAANCLHLKDVLQSFCQRSGQKINNLKSKMFFSKNVGQAVRDNLCSILGFSQTEDLGKYLGVPISAKKLSRSKWQFIIDKVRAKLSGWKSKSLSFAGRTTLAKSVLAVVPNYYMQSALLPASIQKEIDQISRNFIWESEAEQRKIHLVNWNIVSSPKHLGGLGLKSAKEANLVAIPVATGSPAWKAITKGFDLFSSGLKWVPHTGANISFWTDCWATEIPLASMVYGPHPLDYKSITVSDFFTAGGQAPDLISYSLPDEISNKLKATPRSIVSEREDSFAWKGTPRGEFTAASAYYLLKNHSICVNKDWDWIWKLPTIPKIQHFFWLLAHQRLKCFSFLHHLSISTTATCPRCRNEEETVEHLIRRCPSSTVILHDLFPNSPSQQQQQQQDLDFISWLKFNCHCTLKSEVMNIPWNILFCSAIWGIWLHRNQTVHSPHPYQLNILRSTITERAAEFWASIIPKASRTYHEENFKWAKPPPNVIKLNTDGSAKGNPGISAAGGIFRDHHGNWKLGYARKIDWSNCLAAELWAIRDGLQLAIMHNFSHIIVESDSLVAIHLLHEPPPPSHNLSPLIFDCRELLQLIHHAELKHVVRESNMAADQMAKLGHGIDQDFVTFESIPFSVKQYCIADMMGIEFPRMC